MSETGFVKVEFEGMKALAAKLRAIPNHITKQDLETMLLSIGQPIAQDMAAHAPRAQGKGHAGGGQHAADLILALPTPDKRSTKGVAEIEIGMTKKGWYLRFAEFGTYREGARPFMRPTWDAAAQGTFHKIAQGLEGIVAAAAKAVA
jgi:HK97 gp10 family phage protein